MAIEFEKKPIPWKAPGSMPSEELQTSGFQAGYKPAAQTFNALFNNTSECLTELQDSVSGIDTELEDFVRVAHSEEIPSTPILTDSNLLEGQPASYYTNASNITSGVLSVENGGTGANTPSGAISNLHGVEKTTNTITYYVNASTGSDTNNGLTESTPFATIQHAIDILPKWLEHTVKIRLAPGTYGGITITGFHGNSYGLAELRAGGRLEIVGGSESANNTTEENYVVNGVLIGANSTQIRLTGIKGTATASRPAFKVSGVTYADLYNCTAEGTSDGAAGEVGFQAEGGSTVHMTYCAAYNVGTGVQVTRMGEVFAAGMHGSGVAIGYKAEQSGIIYESHGWQEASTYTCTTMYSRTRAGIIVNKSGEYV